MAIEIRREHGPQNTPKHIKTHKTRRRLFVPLKLSETFSNKFQNNLNQNALQGSGVPGIVLEGTLQAGRHREIFWKGACLPSTFSSICGRHREKIGGCLPTFSAWQAGSAQSLEGCLGAILPSVPFPIRLLKI